MTPCGKSCNDSHESYLEDEDNSHAGEHADTNNPTSNHHGSRKTSSQVSRSRLSYVHLKHDLLDQDQD